MLIKQAKNFDGRVAIVTGAAGGLGFEYAKFLAQRGAKVLLNDWSSDPFGNAGNGDDDKLEIAAQSLQALGAELLVNRGSVASEADAKAMVAQALAQWGRVDLLINNAGVTGMDFFPNADNSEIKRIFEINFFGALNMMHAVWESMLQQDYGRIVNICSTSMYGESSSIAYPCSKAALHTATRQVASAARKLNIKVNAVNPAAITRMTSLLPDSPLKQRMMEECQPEKIAPLVAYLLDQQCAVNGKCFSASGDKIAWSTFAESEVLTTEYSADIDADGSVEGVANSIEQLMQADTVLTPVHRNADSLRRFGLL